MCERELCCASLLLQPPRHVVVLMWQWVWDEAVWRVTQQELSERTKKRPIMNTVFEAAQPLSLAFCFCARGKREKETGRWSRGACSPLSVFISFPSSLSFSTISSNWILCGDVLSPISALCFTLNIVLFPLHFLSYGPLAPLPQTSISVLHLFNIPPLVGGCFFYWAWDTCSDSLTERHCTIQ